MNNKKKRKPKMCKIEECKNQASRNPKGGFFDICDFHFQKKKDATKKEVEKTEIVYDSNYKLITKLSNAFLINHPKKIRYIRVETVPMIEKNPDNSITVKSKGRKVVDLPFNNKEEQEKAYQEIKTAMTI
jgi:hypothetical protein